MFKKKLTNATGATILWLFSFDIPNLETNWSLYIIKVLYIYIIYCIFTNKPLQSLHLFPAFLKLWLVSDGDDEEKSSHLHGGQVVPAVPSTVHRPHPGPPFWRSEMAGQTAPRAGRQRIKMGHGRGVREILWITLVGKWVMVEDMMT